MTQEMKATPGPWRYESETKTIRSVPANYWLATMDSFDGAVNHVANARLISAAPELLAEARENVRILRNLIHDLENIAGGPVITGLRKRLVSNEYVICKATGE